jgi:hypothetical protein
MKRRYFQVIILIMGVLFLFGQVRLLLAEDELIQINLTPFAGSSPFALTAADGSIYFSASVPLMMATNSGGVMELPWNLHDH